MSRRPSIRRRLLLGLIATIALTWGVALVYMVQGAGHEVEEVYDAVLAQQARVMTALLNHEAEEKSDARRKLGHVLDELGHETLQRSPTLARVAAELADENADRDYIQLSDLDQPPGHPYESKITVLVRQAGNRILLRSPGAPELDAFEPGFHAVQTNGESWRVFGLYDAGSDLQIQVAEKAEVRRETVTYIVTNAILPVLIALPVFGLIVWISVSKGMRPLNRVAEKVEQRDPNSLQPISIDGVPEEAVPMVQSLNRLFDRVSKALESERRFTANAAHELRTPLAALKTYVQAKQLSDEGQKHAAFFCEVVQGVDRTTHLLEQLLALARADSHQDSTALRRQVDLHGVSISVLSTLGGHALNKDIELSLEGGDGPWLVRGDRTALEILLRNLIDNAIRYTPAGGTVHLSLQADLNAIHWIVADDGPGIPEAQRELLFERFQRGEGTKTQGSGLGLSIVRQIAGLHHAEVRLGTGLGNHGLSVTIVFPQFLADARFDNSGEPA